MIRAKCHTFDLHFQVGVPSQKDPLFGICHPKTPLSTKTIVTQTKDPACLKWHPKHAAYAYFDTLNRDFSSCVWFHTSKQGRLCYFPAGHFIPQTSSTFHTLNKGRSIGKDLVTSSSQSRYTGHLIRGGGSFFDVILLSSWFTYLYVWCMRGSRKWHQCEDVAIPVLV